MDNNLIFLCTACFFAAFVDSISGGGGIISLPAYLLAGIPPHLALGTNKFTSCCSTFSSSIKFAQSKKVDFNILKYLIPFSFIGAILGATTVLSIKTSYLNTIVLILLLFVGLYSLFSKNVGIEDKFKDISKKNITLGIILALFLGFYDGFLGAGVGTFLIFGLIKIYNFNFVRAGGNCKVMNFVGNIASIIVFAVRGEINYKIGLPVAVFMIIGAHLGAKIALMKGSKIIKPIFVTMSLAVAAKLLYSMVL
ncbi:TSUP family transporter [Clostridium sp. P21]|uniref:Probable membrane transporter protein n=1 Tax=Clostridium muellerianum TaxID=2716538 RepID=A0A7Y0EHP0_9CLOT|nr:TSUP family transporter [Clostridium muellerianum]NMM63297.1 TSUP family transporter [Clostridium muellerianum]